MPTDEHIKAWEFKNSWRWDGTIKHEKENHSMKFIISRTSDWERETPPCEEAIKEGSYFVVEVHSLEHLLELKSKWNYALVLTSIGPDGLPAIEIYDDYRE